MENWYEAGPAKEVLDSYRLWAVVGASSDPRRASYGVMRTLMAAGYECVPINPNETEVHGIAAYPTLAEAIEAWGRIEVVDLFRRADQVEGHVREAIDIGAQAIWMQLGVIDEGSAKLATDAGLAVVMDRCPAIELSRLSPAR